MLAYADNAEKRLYPSFPSFDPYLVNRVMDKIKMMEQGTEVAEREGGGRRLKNPFF